MAGLPGSKAFDIGVGFLAVGFLGIIISFILIDKFDRRRIYNIGLATLSVMQLIIGILDCVPDYENKPGVIWAQSTLMVCSSIPPHNHSQFPTNHEDERYLKKRS